MKKICLLFCFYFLAIEQGFGQSATVATFDDLKTAINDANAFAGDYTITIQNNITFTNTNTPATGTTALPDVNKLNGKLIIKGDGSKIERAVGSPIAPVVRFLLVNSISTVEIEKLTIKGWAVVNGEGAGIRNAGTLTLQECIIESNQLSGIPSKGAGIYNNGTLTITKSTIKSNTLFGTNTYGAGIYNDVSGTMNLTDCWIDSNIIQSAITDAHGVGIYNIGTATIKKSTISNNDNISSASVGYGAGIYHNSTNQLTVNYSTISTNLLGTSLGGGEGAGIYCETGTFEFNNISVVNNNNTQSGTSGLFATLGGGTIHNSLFLNNMTNDVTYDSGVPAAASTNNLFTSITLLTSFTNVPPAAIPSVIDNTLRNNGGSTPTHALLANAGNLAIEGGTAIVAGETDQRGETLLGTRKDIGAYEFGTFWVTDNTGFSSNVIGTLSKSLKDANFSFPNAPQNNLNNVSVLKKIKFNIPAPNNTIELFFNPVLKLPIIIDATTQPNYATQPNQRVKWTRGTGNSGIALHINATATGSKVFGLVIGIDVLAPFPFATGIKISADNVQIGDFTTSPLPAFDGLNVFQRCNNAIIINGNNTTVQRNYFGLNTDGTDGGTDTNSSSYDLIVGDSISITGTQIGVSGKGNVFAAKNGGISFGSSSTITTTNILNNRIGFDVNNNNIAGNAAGIHTNPGVNGITIEGNAIGNRTNAAGIVVMPNTSSVIIRTNGIGMAGFAPYTAAPCQIGIDVRNAITNGLTIRGNYIGSATQDGIRLEANAYGGANACIIEDNFIGMTPAPYTARPNTLTGIRLGDGITPISGITVQGNYIGNSTQIGIYCNILQNSTIRNNIIGLTPTIPATIAANGQGIALDGATAFCDNVSIENNTIAGSTSNGINIIRANNTTVKGNFIGTNAANLTGLGNVVGVLVGANATNTIIGDVNATDGNVISGNSPLGGGNSALTILGNSTIVRNNLIGLNSTGTSLIRNENGLLVGSGVTGTIIEDNTISGTNASGGDAVTLRGVPASFRRNKIGTDINGNDLGLGTGVFAIGGRGLLLEGLNPAAPVSIEDNVMVSCQNSGIRIDNSANITIQNNRIGTNNAGTAIGGTPNGVGVWVVNGIFTSSVITNNIISNNATGILLNRPATITTNKIGLGFDTALNDIAIPNSTGIDIGTGLSNITIGGVNATDGNSFAATSIGILSASPCIIQHNTFGTSHDGTIALTNFGNLSLMQPTFATQAISLAIGSNSSTIDNNVICGARNSNPRTILGNTVTGSAEAILIASSDIQVINNKIGITLNDIAIPNDIGVSTKAGATTNPCFIGTMGQGNIISNNKNAAIYLASNAAFTNPISINGNIIGRNFAGTSRSSLPTVVGIAAESSASVGIDNQNIINNTTTSAISLLSIRNTIRDTQIGNLNPATGFNTISGINVTTGCTIATNIVQNCEGMGVQILGSSNTMDSGNQIFNNRLQGVNIRNGNGNRLGENSIYNNGGTATPNPKGVDLNLATVAIQGNDGQPAPVITSATILPMNQMTISGTASPDGSHFCYFYRTTAADVSGNANLVEGKDYIGQATITVTGGLWTTTIPTQPLLTPALSSTDFITMNTQYSSVPSVFNTSEFSPPYLLCPTSITAISTQNVITTCFGTTADVRLNISTNSNAGSRFDIDIDNNGTYDYTSLNLQADAAGKFLLLTGVTGGTAFTNTKVFDIAQNCLSPSFANTVTISNAIKPQPIIRAARLVQATSCSNPNARLIVKLQNFEPNAYYSISIGGVNPLLAQIVGDSLTAVLANVAIGTSIGSNLQVSQAPNCISPNFPFSAVLQTPSPAPDTTLNVRTPNDEISPNFAAQIVVENSKDSVMYSLVRADNSQVIGTEQQGNNSTNLTFSTGILTSDGTYKYVISARHIRTNCAARLAKTVTIKVFSGIYSEDLDILREIYTSTNGDNWNTKWNFSLSFTTFIGVSTFGGRVTSILLPNNNLTGLLTRNTLNLKKLATLDISSNSLDFGSVEPFVNQRFVFTYSNQAKINRSIDTTAYTGTSMTLSLSTRGTANLYQWQKDGINISGATSNSLTINPLQNADAGLYTCLVRNTIGTQLTLTRNNIRLRTITKTVSAADLTLLIKINESLGGSGWINKWKLDGTVPVAELYGIKMEGDKIKYINLADNNLVGTIPDIIPLGSNILSDLIYLNLSGNQISGTIPASIGNLKKLQYLDLSNNALSGEINKEIGDLPDLNTLWLGNNQFKTLHNNLANLTKLENFFVQNNQFTTVFADWSKLTALKKLSLSGNLLKTLPQSLDKLLNLEVLELANNQFVTLPNIFGSMSKLQEITLQNNQLTDLPVSFATLTSLQNMVLHTNFLDFEDLEQLQPLPVLNAEGAVYEPQAKIGTAQEILFTTDQTLDLTQPAKGTANTYLWLKDGQPVNNLTMQRILRNPIAFSDAGVYTLTVKNTIAKKLTLFSREILVRVSCGNSTSIEISQAGTNRYCEGENINTTLSAKALNGIQAVGYQWFRNNARLVNEETSKLSLVQAGSYVVHIRGGDGCVFISQPVEILVAAKPKIDLKQVQEKLQVTVNQSKGKLQYAWYYNNLQIDEARSSELKTTKAGQYYVIVTDSLNCPAKSQVVNLIISGLEDEQNANFKLYPNPTENVLNIEIPLDFDFQTLQVYNLLGQLATVKVQKQDANLLQVQVANLSSGMYWVEIKGKKGSLKRKFVKE